MTMKKLTCQDYEIRALERYMRKRIMKSIWGRVCAVLGIPLTVFKVEKLDK